MLRNVSSRFAFTTLCALAACASSGVKAQTVTPPQVTFAIADGTTLHKSAKAVPIGITVSDSVGLRYAALSGSYSSASNYYRAGTTYASLGMTFYVSYFSPGDYVFATTVVNTSGMVVVKSITVHLLP